MNGNDKFLNINDAHLRVMGGNVHASSFNLDQISITTTSTTASTIDFLNETTAFRARSNIEVGTANLFVNTETSNVGIRTSSPEYALDVHGPANVSVLTASSNVGVGTFSPEYALDVHGSANVGALTATTFSGSGAGLTALDATNIASGTLNVARIPDLDAAKITGGTLNVARIPDLDAAKITGGTLPVSRGGTGTTSSTGSGALVLKDAPAFTGDATFDTDTLKIDASNNRVGIGTNAPGKKLHIYTTATESNSQLELESADRYASMQMKDNSGGVMVQNDQGDLRLLTGYSSTMTGGSETMRIKGGTGRVGIGTDDPATKLHVEHYGSQIGDFEGIRIANHATNLHASSRPAYEIVVSDINSNTGIGNGKFAIGYRGNTSASRTDRLVIDNSGNVGIGTDSPGALLDILGPANEGQHKLILRDANTNLTFRLGLKAGSSGYQTGWTTIDPNSGGGLAIYDVLYVSGTLSVTSTKNFLIDHPLQPTTKKLIHTAVESPRVDLIYRGTTQLKDGRAIVNIDRQCVGDESCAMEDGTFEALCRDPVYYLQNTTDFNRLIGTIDKNLLTIISEDVNSIAIVNWMVVAERKDRDIVEATQTNDNGRLNTEIIDTSERVNRDGSVRYSSA